MKILDTIRKLFAKAESARELGSAEEAALFAAKAQELLLKHKLDESLLETVIEEDPMGREDLEAPEWLSTRTWIDRLVNNITAAYFCKAIWTSKKERRMAVMGKRSDREVALYLVQTLVAEGKRLVAEFMARQPEGDRRSQRLRNSFLLGYTSMVLQRVREQRARSEQAGGQHAITLFRNAQRETDDAFRAAFPFATGGKSRRDYVHAGAHAAGKAAGQAVGIGGIRSGASARASFLIGGGR